jgi:hypothetical protein
MTNTNTDLICIQGRDVADVSLAGQAHCGGLGQPAHKEEEAMTEDQRYVSKYREIEFKYNADSIKLKDYMKFAESHKPVDFIEVGSWDFYFSSENTKFNFEFIRYRQGPKPELTIKVKLNENNNNDRIEIDVPLDPQRCTIDDITQFCAQLGFTLNVVIYKICYIHVFADATTVYYLVYDSDMNEKGRYIEVEARKDVDHGSEEGASEVAKRYEKGLEVLGITPQNRIKKSQWEMCRR